MGWVRGRIRSWVRGRSRSWLPGGCRSWKRRFRSRLGGGGRCGSRTWGSCGVRIWGSGGCRRWERSFRSRTGSGFRSRLTRRSLRWGLGWVIRRERCRRSSNAFTDKRALLMLFCATSQTMSQTPPLLSTLAFSAFTLSSRLLSTFSSTFSSRPLSTFASALSFS